MSDINWEDKYHELESEYDTFRIQSKELETQFEEMLQDKENELANEVQNSAKILENLTKLKKENNTLYNDWQEEKEKNKIQQSKLKDLQLKLVECENDLETQSTHLRNAEYVIKELENKIALAEENIIILKENNQETANIKNDEIISLQQEIRELKDEINILQAAKKNDVNNNLLQQSIKESNVEEEVQQLKNEKENLLYQIKLINAEKQDLICSYEKIKEKIIEKEAEFENELLSRDKIYCSLKKECDEITQDIQSFQKNEEVVIAKAKESLDTFYPETVSLMSIAEAYNSKIGYKEKQIIQLQKKLAEYKITIHELEKQNSIAQQQNAKDDGIFKTLKKIFLSILVEIKSKLTQDLYDKFIAKLNNIDENLDNFINNNFSEAEDFKILDPLDKFSTTTTKFTDSLPSTAEKSLGSPVKSNKISLGYSNSPLSSKYIEKSGSPSISHFRPSKESKELHEEVYLSKIDRLERENNKLKLSEITLKNKIHKLSEHYKLESERNKFSASVKINGNNTTTPQMIQEKQGQNQKKAEGTFRQQVANENFSSVLATLPETSKIKKDQRSLSVSQNRPIVDNKKLNNVDISPSKMSNDTIAKLANLFNNNNEIIATPNISLFVKRAPHNIRSNFLHFENHSVCIGEKDDKKSILIPFEEIFFSVNQEEHIKKIQSCLTNNINNYFIIFGEKSSSADMLNSFLLNEILQYILGKASSILGQKILLSTINTGISKNQRGSFSGASNIMPFTELSISLKELKETPGILTKCFETNSKNINPCTFLQVMLKISGEAHARFISLLVMKKHQSSLPEDPTMHVAQKLMQRSLVEFKQLLGYNFKKQEKVEQLVKYSYEQSKIHTYVCIDDATMSFQESIYILSLYNQLRCQHTNLSPEKKQKMKSPRKIN